MDNYTLVAISNSKQYVKRGKVIMLEKIKKRDGRIVRFNPEKINDAVTKAFIAQNMDPKLADEVTSSVLKRVDSKFRRSIPTVEDIQDEVEHALVELKYTEVAKAYIIYREERNKVRDRNTRLMTLRFQNLRILILSVKTQMLMVIHRWGRC